MSTSLGTFPRPVPRPLPGVTQPASPECPTPQSRGWLWSGWWVVEVVDLGVVDGVGHKSVRCCGRDCWPRVVVVVLLARGRLRCRRCVPQECSRLWACLLVEDWVVLLAVVVVDGVCFVGVRGCGRGCWPRGGLSRRLLMAVVGVDGAGFSCVRGCGYVRWPRIGSLCWPTLWSMVCSTSVFDDVGVTAGRGVGGRVSCSRPLSWRYPTGFAGVCFATVLGLGVWWSVLCVFVDVLWPWWVSMVRAFRVFERVGVPAGRGLGRVAGRYGCRWRGLSACSSMFEGVGVPAGRRLGRLVACWWTTFACSRVLVGLLAVVWVVWVACWWTTCVVLGWAC